MHAEVPPIRALLVDDDPALLMLLSAFLEARGYHVDQAENGRLALEKLTSLRHRLVITDRSMPDMDGIALCRTIRAQPLGGYTYCIMLTSSGDEQTLVEAMEAGADDFLAKPVRVPQLGARLRAAERVLALESSLAERNRELHAAYEQLSRELELARALQLSLLPAPAQFAGLQFDWLFQASSFVGGDTFDYFPLGEQVCGFYLVDVAGHGVAAAMMAFNAHHHLRTLSQQIAAPMLREGGDVRQVAAAVVAEYNRAFIEGATDPGHYLTMLFGIADRRAGVCAMVQAGHPPPLLSRAGEHAFRPSGAGGLPVGILPDASFDADLFALGPGDRIVLYSDGITDCRNARGEAFGEDRLGLLLAQQRAAPLAHTGGALRQALQSWHGPAPDDDVTLLIFDVA
ncbi:SpoIIE family protein phosphatase [Ramlibacter sp. AN1015]|uniref:PP2C family protein-serine/threonine phosphatase n=1 Tax=Ramlibacter sp. AN1015 TaxID=3133428 RepID=UPI0030C4BE99